MTENEPHRVDIIKQVYNSLLEYKANGALIRARAETIECNEISDAYFFGKKKVIWLKCLYFKYNWKMVLLLKILNLFILILKNFMKI